MTTTMMAGSINPLFQGFLLCASIIIAVGPQNLFILRQGLRRQHLFAIALFSTLADLILITLGVGGLSTLISSNSYIQAFVSGGGVLFLLWCGSRSLISACRPSSPTRQVVSFSGTASIKATILTTLSFSFLNPGAYFDTLVIIGSKSLFFPVDQRLIFGIGAVLASTFWFFTLAYGASKISPLFRSQVAWRTLDIVSGCLMLGIAFTVLAAQFVTL